MGGFCPWPLSMARAGSQGEEHAYRICDARLCDVMRCDAMRCDAMRCDVQCSAGGDRGWRCASSQGHLSMRVFTCVCVCVESLGAAGRRAAYGRDSAAHRGWPRLRASAAGVPGGCWSRHLRSGADAVSSALSIKHAYGCLKHSFNREAGVKFFGRTGA